MKLKIKSLVSRLLYQHGQWSLQKRLILSYVLILLLPSIMVSLYLFNQFSDMYIQDIQKKGENTLEMERLNVNNHIETMERTAQLSISDNDVLEYLITNTEPDTSELIAFSQKAIADITRLQYNNPNIEHIRLFTDNKRVNELYPVIWQESRITSESWFHSVKALNGVESWRFIPHDRSLFVYHVEDGSQNLPKLALLQEVEYPLGSHAGILEIDMRLNKFFPKTYGSTADELSQIVIMDNRGQLFYNEGQALLLRTGVSKDELQSKLMLSTNEEPVSYRFQLGSKPFLGIHSYIEPLDAHMVNIVALEGVLRDMHHTRNQIIAANIILIALLSVATYFLNALILKQLHVLTDSMKKVRQGNFQLVIPVGGGAEVGELAHHFRKMLRKINELIADAVNKKAASKETELRSLKNQIDSHFLYNTLENIKMLAEIEQQYTISDALTSLGGLMRYNLKWTSEYVRLRDEVNHIINYIALMNVRFEHQIQLITDISPLLQGQELLKMSLQPIVENTVKHGFLASTADNMTITITAAVEESMMIITIKDNGMGMAEDKLRELNRKIRQYERSYRSMDGTAPAHMVADEVEEEGSGIGLRNVQERIELYYGREYGIHVESEEGEYTCVIMQIPYLILTGGAS